MSFRIIRNDITKVKADAIVNTANPEPIFASGTDRAVYLAAGEKKLLAERKKIGRIQTGEVAVTPAFKLKAKYIIHTVGPVWYDGTRGELEALASCYRKSLLIAEQLKCRSIAFPLISTGVYGFPKDRALSVAMETIEEFLRDSDMDVTLVVFNKSAFDLSAELVEDVRQFIDDHYVEERHLEEYGGTLSDARNEREWERRRARLLKNERQEMLAEDSFSAPFMSQPTPMASIPLPSAEHPSAKTGAAKTSSAKTPASKTPSPKHAAARPSEDLPRIMGHLEDTFQERLLDMIDERGLTDTEVYKRANLDRKLFSKIRCNPNYKPKKQTALALSVALHLDLEETADLLGRAGLALSRSSRFDLIVEYCIRNQIYNIMEINALLFQYDQPLLVG